ncbi:HAD family hydrolase [Faecalibacter rhinopitheci]|uniref:phosphoglycolate phosphatase n=1 Tax=Faecalibacter rhinopitheci TaxID=2779678 RepID=A0A8J7KDK1_9FLAO|nr:HAD family phosphatase [Faecalibacter rhinopitheci]MBF0597421.1 HAD family phosphatase [Faecalibacter rhinopitheci]
MEQKIKAIFFDFDGVIVDSLQLWNLMFEEVGKTYKLNATCLLENDGLNFTTNEAIQLMLENQQRFTTDLYEEIIDWTELFYVEHFHHYIKLNDYVIEMLGNLKSNHIQILLVSNSSRKQINHAFKVLKLHPYFDHTITADDVLKGKPDAEPYLKALLLSQKQKEEIIVIEDSLTGIDAAKNAGLTYKIYKHPDYIQHPNYLSDFREIIKMIQ